MGYIAEQQCRKPDSPLRVEFVPATNSTVKYYGTVSEIHNRAEIRSDSGSADATSSAVNTVLIKVALDDGESLRRTDPPVLRPGAACLARVDCGYRPLGFVLFYEVIAFVQKNVLFRWF